ncbi:hypothetical protein AYO21_01574 [Fonsecaea monophora]|uniref:FAD-binding PCMH-type domain-containing protein n=1 Tax=Fonsecaea monophora TaxID=254056 RepID=A0A177FIV7_9EURO|nr:hypothetical protein AYO21_01574 [Fonsecaea monophora]KAH0835357.1 isoamyl alcohol oxidase [Fonsecaea pedrosoi]OAG44117.1 hypothetical protein AYO21_01574 [Fonsecaea monophora]
MKLLYFVGSASLLLLQAICVAAVPMPSVAPGSSCKCVPDDKCWPCDALWKLFNLTVGGNLIATKPVAASCYSGPTFNPAQCAYVDINWSSATFQADLAIGLSYPTNITCAPVNLTVGNTPQQTCTLGVSPSYAVNCTDIRHVALAVVFSRLFNIRLVVKNTGHDQLGRSEGANGLEIWIRHLRSGITFQETFKPSTRCTASKWTGSAFKIAGGYTWGDVGAEAQKHNVVIVNGGTPSVGAIGGWMQGGGHGPASRDYGLGADQVLELEVVLADGTLVTANACQHSDLYFALRGGGGGTYGIVVSSTIKAYPMVNVTVQHLAMFPLSANTSGLLDAVAILYSCYPDLNDAGYAGYGQWSINSQAPIFANMTTGYVHGFRIFNATIEQAQTAFDVTRSRLAPLNLTSVFISESYASYADYWTYYHVESGVEPPVGLPAYGAGSRLFDRPSVTQNSSALRNMVETIAGTPKQLTTNNFELVGGGQVFRDASDPFSGVAPAWRTSYFSNIVARIPSSPNAPQAELDEKQRDITTVKVPAMKKLAPHTGAYMNEADRFDPDWKADFYGPGHHYARLLAIKRKYDPHDLFYCPTCVGSDAFEMVAEGGRLCRVRREDNEEQNPM